MYASSVLTTLPRANSLLAAAWVAGWRRYVYGPEEFPISAMVSEMTGTDLDAQTLAGLDAPYPDESYKAGPKRMPMMIPATTLSAAARPNRGWYCPQTLMMPRWHWSGSAMNR